MNLRTGRTDELLEIRIESEEGAVGLVGVAHGGAAGVHDGGGEAGVERERQEGGVDGLAAREAEGDVGDAEDAPDAELLADEPDGAQRDGGGARVGAHGEAERVDHDVAAVDAARLGLADDPLRDGEAPLGRSESVV